MNLYCSYCNLKLQKKNIRSGICPCAKRKKIKKKIIIQKKIKALVTDYFKEEKKEKFEYGKTVIPLSIPTYSKEEAFESIQSILTTYVVFGPKVKQFENMFSKYLFLVCHVTIVRLR